MKIRLRVQGSPKPKGSLKHVGRGRLVEQVKGSTAWKEAVAWQARSKAARARWDAPGGPRVVTATVWLPRPPSVKRAMPTTRSSGDVDKHARNLLDGLAEAGVFADDSQVTDLHIRKRYADGQPPGVQVVVEEIDERGDDRWNWT